TKSGKKKEHNRVFESVKAYFFGRAHGSHGMVMNVHSDSRPFAFPPMPPLPPMEMPPFPPANYPPFWTPPFPPPSMPPHYPPPGPSFDPPWPPSHHWSMPG